jgi:hypothetical protein
MQTTNIVCSMRPMVRMSERCTMQQKGCEARCMMMKAPSRGRGHVSGVPRHAARLGAAGTLRVVRTL